VRNPRFKVLVNGDLEPYRAEDKVVIFHGVNKSGSMCLANVLRTAYILARRRKQFYCHYHRGRLEFDEMLQRIEDATPHRIFISHHLYGKVAPRHDRYFATMFRHPLVRVISGYQWTKNKFVAQGNAPEEFQTLEEFVERGGGISWSLIAQFARAFAHPKRSTKWTPSPEETYQQCRQNLERDVRWFGIAELFEETIFIFAAICGLPRVPAWERDVRNPGRALARELPATSEAMIRHFYRYDFALYEHALDLFRERLSQLELAGDFSAYKAYCAGEYKERLLVEQEAAQHS
jgi:hypothetical protein